MLPFLISERDNVCHFEAEKHRGTMRPAKTKTRRGTEEGEDARLATFVYTSRFVLEREKPRDVPPVACPVTAPRWPSQPDPAKRQVSTVPVGESRIYTKYLRGRKGT